MDRNPVLSAIPLQAVYRKPRVLLMGLAARADIYQYAFHLAMAQELNNCQLPGDIIFERLHFDEHCFCSPEVVAASEAAIKLADVVIAWTETCEYDTPAALEFFRLCHLRWNQPHAPTATREFKFSRFFLSPESFDSITGWDQVKHLAVKMADLSNLGDPGDSRARFALLAGIKEAAPLAAMALPNLFKYALLPLVETHREAL